MMPRAPTPGWSAGGPPGPPPRPLPPGAGFTLIEILVAFGILALVMGAVYSSLTSSLYATRYVEERADVYHTGLQIISRMSRELSSAYLTDGGYTYFTGQHDEVEGRRMDRLTFTTLAHRMIPVPIKGMIDSEHAAVAYDWKIENKDDEEPRLTLYYRESTSFVQGAAGEEYELSGGLKELDIRYLQGRTGTWLDEWDSQLQGGLPTAVAVTLVLADAAGSEVPFRTLVLPKLAKP